MKAIAHIIFVFLLITPYAQGAQSSQETDDLKVYAEKIINDVYDIFNDKNLSSGERSKKIKDFITENLHLDWMAKYALGRHRRTIPKNKINEFVKVYSDFIVKAYTDLSASYNGEKSVLKNIKQINEDMFMIHMELIKPNGQPPIKIDYLVHEIDNSKTPYRVGDIITEGISILNSQQAEFNNVITTHGIDGLIKDLRSRIDSSK